MEPGVKPTLEATLEAARDTLHAASGMATASFDLARAEFHLARASAASLVVMALLLVVLATGAWLAISAAIAAGIYQLSGNLFIGIGSVALLNVLGIAYVLLLMRTRLTDLSFPHTRELIAARTALPPTSTQESAHESS